MSTSGTKAKPKSPAKPRTVSKKKTATAGELVDSNTALKKPTQQSVTYSVSGGFVNMLAQLNISLALTSYQSGKFYLMGRNPKGGLMIDERMFQKAMGMSVDQGSGALTLATLFQIHHFENVLGKGEQVNHTYDACYVPRISYTTGVLDAHDIGVRQNGEIIFVNTRFNCLATLSKNKSFTPIWKPHFIDKIIDEDRCHLNGLAMEDGTPKYVTAVSKSNTIDGWRDRRGDGGVVIDVQSNKLVCEGLSMPHSPRIYNGKLWILNSGTGELGWVDVTKKRFEPVVFCPGFVRGLAFTGKYALVGLSKPRYKRFEGLALDQKLKDADSEAWCGIQIIDLETRGCVEWFRIDGAIGEVYDVAALNGITCPMSLGFVSNDIKSLITHEEMSNEAATSRSKPSRKTIIKEI